MLLLYFYNIYLFFDFIFIFCVASIPCLVLLENGKNPWEVLKALNSWSLQKCTLKLQKWKVWQNGKGAF